MVCDIFSLSLRPSPLDSMAVSITTWATVTPQLIPPTCLSNSTCPRGMGIQTGDTRCRGKYSLKGSVINLLYHCNLLLYFCSNILSGKNLDSRSFLIIDKIYWKKELEFMIRLTNWCIGCNRMEWFLQEVNSNFLDKVAWWDIPCSKVKMAALCSYACLMVTWFG